jgi:hypothetical protein
MAEGRFEMTEGRFSKTLMKLQYIKVAIPKCPPLSMNKVIIFLLE